MQYSESSVSYPESSFSGGPYYKDIGITMRGGMRVIQRSTYFLSLLTFDLVKSSTNPSIGPMMTISRSRSFLALIVLSHMISGLRFIYTILTFLRVVINVFFKH